MLFLPLTKADAVNRLVYARAAAEEPDKSREIMDYASGRPQFELWSGRFKEATLGKSLGNIRAMHNPRHLAGVVKQITYDDDAKAVDVCFKVLDPVDWVKVEEGGYTGLSIGGGYLKKWTDPSDPSLTRYTPRLAEISLVDSPCIPSARIMELQKQDGTTTEVMLKGVPRSFKDMLPPPTFGEALAKISFSTFGRAGRATQSVFEHPATQRAITYGKKVSDVVGGAGKVMGTVRTAKELALLGAAAGGAVGLYRSRRHDRKKGTVAGQAATPIGTQPLTKADDAQREKIRQTLHEFKHGKLHSFRANLPKKKMPKVTDRKQAIAIALSQARRMSKQEEPMKKVLLPLLLGAGGAYGGARILARRGAKMGYRHFFHGGPVESIAHHTALGGLVGGVGGGAAGVVAGKLIEGRKKKPKIGKSDYGALIGGLEQLDKGELKGARAA